RSRPLGIFDSSAIDGRLSQAPARPAFSILSRPMARSREKLKAATRADFGSRGSLRLRREGPVPGVVYSGGSEARPFQVAEREVRTVLAGGQALFDLELEDSKAVPVVVKEQQH